MVNRILELLEYGWIGTLVGLLGIVLAVYFYLRSRVGACLAQQHEEVRLIGGGGATFPEEVEVRFHDTVVPQITSTKIWIWNAGVLTIRGADIVASDPLRVEFDDGTSVLKASILKQSRPVLGTQVGRAPDESRVLITFDFLDRSDGLLLEVLHSGAVGNFRLVGTLRGIPRGISNLGHAPLRPRSGRYPFGIRSAGWVGCHLTPSGEH